MRDITNIIKNKGFLNRNLRVYSFDTLVELKKYATEIPDSKSMKDEEFLFFLKGVHYLNHEDGFEHFFIENYHSPQSTLEAITNSSAILTGLAQREYILCHPKDPKKIKSGIMLDVFGKISFLHDNYEARNYSHLTPYINILKYKIL